MGKYGSGNPDPEHSAFEGVVSCEGVQISLTHYPLSNIYAMTYDIKNAYLRSPYSDKHSIICGPEFGLENFGKVSLIQHSLYVGEYSGVNFWKHLHAPS